MNRLTRILLLGACSWSAVSAAPVDFTPRLYTTNFDGVQVNRIAFRWGSREIEYQPPQGWEPSSSSESVFFKPSRDSSARMEITHNEGTPAPKWDEAGLRELRQRSIAVLPSVPELKLLAEVQDPMPVDGNTGILYTFSGILYSQEYRFMVLLLPLSDEQFNFVFYAPEKEFEKSSKRFVRSIRSFRAK